MRAIWDGDLVLVGGALVAAFVSCSSVILIYSFGPVSCPHNEDFYQALFSFLIILDLIDKKNWPIRIG